MKILKSAISIVLVMSMLLSISVAFSSCSDKTDKTSIKIGEYLATLSDKFGMDSYQSEEPHVANIGKDNKYFGVVQTSFEWNVIDDSELDTEKDVDREFVANTLVKAVGLKDVSDMNTEGIAKYASENGYVTFKYRGERDSNKLVTKSEVEKSLNASFDLFSNRNYGEGESKVKLAEGVKDLTSLEANSYLKDNNANKIVVSKNEYEKLAGSQPNKNDILVMPASDVETISAYKIESVKTDGSNYVISTSEENVPVESVMQEYKSQGTTKVDFSKAEITDGLGNVIASPETNAAQMDVTEKPKVGYIGTDVNAESKAVAKDEITPLNVTISGVHITGSFSKERVKFTAEGDLYNSGPTKIKFNKTYSMDNFVVSHKVDGGILGLKYAFAQVSYDTTDTSTLNFDYKKTGNFAPEYTNGNGKFATNFKRAILKDSTAKGAKNIKICNFKLVGSEVASLRLEVRLIISVSGEITVTVTTNNKAGMEFKKNSGIRWIKEEDRTTDFNIHGQFSVGLYLGLGVYLVGDHCNILSGGVTFTIGVVADLSAHIKDDSNRLLEEFDIENGNDTVANAILKDLKDVEYENAEYGKVKLDYDTCINAKVYWQITAGLNDDCVAKKKLLKNEKTSRSWGGEKDGVFLEMHFEDGKKVSGCTRKYSNVEAATTTTEAPTTEENKQASIFKVNSYNVKVAVGGSAKAEIIELPNGYNRSDIEFNSQNTEIATVNSNGDVTGVSTGSTVVTAQTKDGKYKVSWAVTVE